MRVHDMFLSCVGFIGEVAGETPSGIVGDLCGTGFIVSVEMGVGFVYYFVTARHVVARSNEREFYILVNKREGGIVSVQSNHPWRTHPTDHTADVAVQRFDCTEDISPVCLTMGAFATPAIIEKYSLGVGDEVFVVGLFTYAPGERQNMPIVRYGNVAMIPKEQIQTELGFADVYLIEARSIGGLSGSPVFIRETIQMPIRRADGTDASMYGVAGMFCLGLMHGHWDIEESKMNRPYFEHDPRRGVNLGIGIVVPAIKILETLNQPDLVAEREQWEKEVIKKYTPTMDRSERS